MIIIPHIAKTGGMSFRHYLKATFGPRLYMDYPRMRDQAGSRWRRLVGQCLRQPVPWGTRCIIGHFPATKYAAHFPHAHLGTWLREPVQRVVSHYHYFCRHQKSGREKVAGLAVRPMSLAEFIVQPAMQNVQAKVLRRRPLTDFAFLGITEEYDLGLRLFARIFGCSEQADLRQLNRNPERKSHGYDVEPAMLAQIRECNRDDLDLYQQGLARFAELCCGHGLAEGRQVA